ncbi:MAG: ribosome small subunit-dependent GTPase A, partial [Clostridiales bacterium]|nr:ribosome small subunit-dependent GTPase A [Clostridiales bacterium]
ARGRFRLEKTKPLVGDYVTYSLDSNGKGMIDSILPRKNSFSRPAVANIDCMILLISAVNPVTEPFVADRVIAAFQRAGCEIIICVNKSDLDSGDKLYDIYSKTDYKLIRTSASSGEGVDELRRAISGKLCVFTGNSGVGKSSLINRLSPELSIKVGEVSEKLGRGRHTTRHVEIFSLGDGAYIADTPGFSSFEMDRSEFIPKKELQFCFSEFLPYIGRCRFDDCAHLKEPDCAVLSAVEEGIISKSRHESYGRLYEEASKIKDWELEK